MNRPMRLRPFLAALASVFLATAAQAGPTCPLSPAAAPMHLPGLQTALAARAEAVIVALGSSSTEGIGASDAAHSYPSQLQAELSRLLPAIHVTVINRGIGGQDAPEEVARLEHDVLAIKPRLVIWQVGANGALRHADPAAFQALVSEGVGRLKRAGIDVVLMDNQRAPRILAVPGSTALDHVLAEVAAHDGVNMFSRAGLMDAWDRAGASYHAFIAPDGLHHNDLGYACVARTLARRIADAVSPPVALSASR